MKLFLILVLSTFLVCNACSAYKILVVFPYPGKSHTILGEGYVKHLLRAGHEVTYITPALLKPHTNLRQIDVSSNIPKFQLEKFLNITKLLNKDIDLTDMGPLYYTMFEVGNTSVTHENVQKFLLEDPGPYDVVISEWLYTELYCGFAAIFKAPYIWSVSLEPHPMVMTLIDEIHNPAYAPDNSGSIAPPETFSDRVHELWNVLNLYYQRWFLKDMEEKAFRDAFGPAAAKRGIVLPTLEELKHNSSMMLANSHVSLGLPLRLPQNFKPIAGYHISDEISPLAENFQKIMDNAPNGVIYFSLGTMMKSKTLPSEIKKGLLQVFGKLKQTVIWKIEEEMKDLPKNVHIVQWAPQQSILAHSNCKLFITHGGLLSTTEALHFGVPVIGVPLCFDQIINVFRAVQRGYALRVDIGYDMPEQLKGAIEAVFKDPKYALRAKQLSFIYHHRPIKPGDELIHWVEHVIQTRGSHHLRSPAFSMPLYQRLYLDLVTVILVAILILLRIVKKLFQTKEDKKETKKVVKKKKQN